ncbi:MAG: DNA-binding response regulator [Candidatus Omnitrophica bacterium CG11_big_fil_rev_8_21_14_0_20_42_13]|uniref:DNA-binding response regulator n=1 Tax=Candidatus Ghiorseimicrobium undicola TaxID=1974746 RepID=A0A2H0LWC1_9BACT|nr:MAG: DNA-binding response regulator [Candidatus Omnitrophica bacterium CG11_big_fil_rev_8_21_14_0_20_42_13]
MPKRVFIIDDDPSVRKGLARLIKSAGFHPEPLASAEGFLQKTRFNGPACLVLDVRMPGLSGIDLQKEMIKKGISLPVIFITGHGNIPMSVNAMKDGAVDFLPKPFDDTQLLSAIERAINKNIRMRKNLSEKEKIQRRIKLLTPREYDVLRWVITGRLNKQIAAKLGVTEKTVKVHRGRLMQKMQVKSVAELVVLTQKCEIGSPKR